MKTSFVKRYLFLPRDLVTLGKGIEKTPEAKISYWLTAAALVGCLLFLFPETTTPFPGAVVLFQQLLLVGFLFLTIGSFVAGIVKRKQIEIYPLIDTLFLGLLSWYFIIVL